MAGSKELAQSLKGTFDNQNVSFVDAADSAGYKIHPEHLHNVFLNQDTYFAFIELHIEQGPILEKEGRISFTLINLCGVRNHFYSLTHICS